VATGTAGLLPISRPIPSGPIICWASLRKAIPPPSPFATRETMRDAGSRLTDSILAPRTSSAWPPPPFPSSATGIRGIIGEQSTVVWDEPNLSGGEMMNIKRARANPPPLHLCLSSPTGILLAVHPAVLLLLLLPPRSIPSMAMSTANVTLQMPFQRQNVQEIEAENTQTQASSLTPGPWPDLFHRLDPYKLNMWTGA
jgi:hypothetical protein